MHRWLPEVVVKRCIGEDNDKKKEDKEIFQGFFGDDLNVELDVG